MDNNNLLEIMANSKAEITKILNECVNSSSELALLSSIMQPILEDFSNIEADLIASTMSPKVPERSSESKLNDTRHRHSE